MELALRPTPRSVLERTRAMDGKALFSRPRAGAFQPFRLLFAFLQKARGADSAETDARTAFFRQRTEMLSDAYGDSLLRPFRLLFAFLQRARGTVSTETDERAAFFRQRAGELLDAYGDSILRLAYSYLHNRSDAEDILQDTLMKYLTAQPDCESETHEKAWLMRVAINLSKNRIESNRYRAHDELDDHFLADEAPDLAYVWDAVRQLPPECAEVLHLHYQEGYSCAEIAGLLKRNEATVRSQLSRSRAKLREILKENYDFGE